MGISDHNRMGLFKLLQDITVFDINMPNAIKLSEYSRLERMAPLQRLNSSDSVEITTSVLDTPTNQALQMFIKHFLAYFQSTFLESIRNDLERKQSFSNLIVELNHSSICSLGSICSVLDCDNRNKLAHLKMCEVSLDLLSTLFEVDMKTHYYAHMEPIYSTFYNHILKYTNEADKGLLQESLKSLKMKKSNSSCELGASSEPHGATSMLGSLMHFSLTPSHVALLKTLLVNSCTVASYSPRVWRQVFNLCGYITELENTMFRSCHSNLLSKARVSISSLLRSNSITLGLSSMDSSSSCSANTFSSVSKFNILPGINEMETFNIEMNFEKFIKQLKGNSSCLQIKVSRFEFNGKCFSQFHFSLKNWNKPSSTCRCLYRKYLKTFRLNSTCLC